MMKTKQLVVCAVVMGGAVGHGEELSLAQPPAVESMEEIGAEEASGNFFSSIEPKGVDVFASYVGIGASNVSGGIESDSVYAGQIYAGVHLDLEQLWNWKGARVKVSMVNRHGETLAGSVGSVFDPVTIYGGQTTFLYDLSIEKDFTDAFSVKVGRMAATDDFSTSPLYAYSLNNTVNGPIRALLLDGVMSSFPFPVWGTRLEYVVNEEHRFRMGAYQVSDSMWDASAHGTDFDISGDDGLSVFLQYDWTGEIAGRNSRMYLGTHQAFDEFETYGSDGTEGQFSQYYGHIDHEILDDLQVFLTAAYSGQGELARIEFQSSFGLIWKGLFPARPEDRTVLYATYGDYSAEYGEEIGEDRDYEIVCEIGHRFQLGDAYCVQPSVQYIHRPGGTGDIDDSVVLGVWLGMDF
ncbi:carbohydrate porin [Rubritalea spongiae]|uniref:Carbohydrate porin n=1 Tax=Rubritalea spongiae TaxID=430797 RepID=A0ABW5E386_9BACT